MDWIMGLLGGLLIGLGGAVYLLGTGRIMGGLVDGSGRATWADRLLFLAGVAGVPAALVLMRGDGASTGLTGNWAVIIIGGVLVGLGTRIANGCTSGHGVCGISRLSPRGIVATIIYIGAGAAAMVLFRHALGVI